MSELQREHLSAGMDGELSADELRFLLRRLEHDAASRLAWTRYHLMRDGLRRQLPSLASAGFAERVWVAVDQPAHAENRRVPHWLRWSAGGAIAAGVAVVALMSVRNGEDVAPVAGTPAAHEVVAAVDPATKAPMASTPPASVPPWLLLNDNTAARYSQRASATFGGDAHGNAAQPYLRGFSPYPLRRMPVSGDGSYLLLIDAPQTTTREAPRQAAAAPR